MCCDNGDDDDNDCGDYDDRGDGDDCGVDCDRCDGGDYMAIELMMVIMPIEMVGLMPMMTIEVMVVMMG